MQFGLREHLATIFRHRRTIGLVFLGAVAVAGGFAFLATPVYVADTRMLILDYDPTRRVAGTANPAGDVVLSPEQRVLTQVEIARRPQLAERVARELGPDRVLERMTGRWEWLQRLPTRLTERAREAAWTWPPSRRVLETLGWRPPAPAAANPLDAARERLVHALHIDAVPKTDMFVIAAEAPDPVFAATVVDTLVDVYLEHLTALRLPVEAARLAAAEADRLEAELRRAEERAREFAETHGIVAMDAQTSLLLERLSDAETALAAAAREQREAERNAVALRAEIAELPARTRTSTVTRRNPAADHLVDRIATLEARARRFVPGSAAAAGLEAEIAAVRAELRSVGRQVSEAETSGANRTREDLRTRLALAQVDARALALRAELLDDQVAALRAELGRLDGHAIAYRERVRAAEAKAEALRYARRRAEETAISERVAQASLSRVVPVGPALIPSLPDRPQRRLTLVLGALVGLGGGFGLAYGREFVRRTMATREEVEAALGHPTLASLVRTHRRDRDGRRNRIACRTLINSVPDLRHRRGAVALLVASARAGEGRSYVAEALARALRDEGADVLVVNLEPTAVATTSPPPRGEALAADPSAFERLPAASDDGGRRDAVHLAGPAAEAHSRLDAMLEEWRDRHEVVVIDSPPLEQCPEQLRLVARFDSVVFVVDAERTPVFAARRGLDALEDAGAAAIGVVLNKRRFEIPGWIYHWLLRPA